MSFFSDVAGVFTNAAAFAAGGPLGMIASNFAKDLLASAIDQVIEQLPVPQPVKDLLQANVHMGLGDVEGGIENYQEAMEGLREVLNPFDYARTEQAMNDFKEAIEDFFMQMLKQADEEKKAGGGESTEGGDRNSWLRAMAKALGAQLNDLADEMQQKADNINTKDPSTLVEFQTISQEFSMLMNTTTTAIKTLGEAMGQAARKN